MDVHALEVFCRIVELKSFSRAAEAVALTQPTVSGHIKALEEEVGLRLLDRLGKVVTPTKAGTLLYRYAKQILALRGQAIQALDQYKGSLRGTLVVGGSNIPGEYVLPGLLARFKERYPDVTLTLAIAGSREILRGVVEGHYEIGTVGARFEDGQLVYTKFIADEMVLALPPGHRFSGRTAVRLRELATEPFVLRELASGSRKVTEEALARHGLAPASLKVVAELGSTEAVRQAIKTGIGISFISRRAIAEDVERGTLASVSVVGLKLVRDFYIVTHKHRTRSPVGEAFLR
ncbi:MAG: selenium metabolism-associated LysR family transcriptional regulator, partial [Candidatus Methylomirabilales bacterium]